MLLDKKILVVEDQAVNRMMLCAILSSQYTVLEAENGVQALAVLEKYKEGISLILLDIHMPVMDGYTFLQHFKEDPRFASVPVIVTTSNDSEEDEVSALSHGATDFITKPYRTQVILHRVASIIHLRETSALISQIRYDRVTGVYSKEFFYQQARDILFRNPDVKYDILCSDIEDFKLINDTFGAAAGDRLLKQVAELYTRSLGDYGICGRLGADQFACLLEHREDYADEMFTRSGSQINNGFRDQNVVMKYGIYMVEDREVPVEQMCDRALLAAQSIKGRYGRHFAFYDDKLRGTLLRRQAITDGMEAALDAGQFEVYLQPRYRMEDGQMDGAEALVRWNHPEWGMQPPAEFIPIFERNGFISKMDLYVWERVCALLGEWDKKGYPCISISVNVSRMDIHNVDLPEVLNGLIARYGLAPSRLHLEITESAYTDTSKQMIDTLDHLRRQGFVIEMDDFGSGYSSLNMLTEMPIDVLKLDMKFIQTEITRPADQGILPFIVSLARRMKLSVVAEGVETREQLERLQKDGCDYAQGYYLAKPMPVEAFEEILIASSLTGALTDHEAFAPAGEREAGIEEKEQIETSMTAWETLQAFCRAWFERRSAEETYCFLADEFCFVGTGEHEFAHSPQEMMEYLIRDIQEIPEPFSVELTLCQEQELNSRIRNLSVGMNLKNSQYSWRLRGFFTLESDGCNWRFRTLWFSEPGASQLGEEHYPHTLVVEDLARQREALLNEALPGGMMGGYIEKGFPFYFVNSRMLKYLGYADEAEFVADIRGMVSNCMHPDDRDLVDAEVAGQMAERGEYMVEYRMKKQDGSYIWVQDLGHEVTAKDGRPAIISVCIDITKQKKAQAEVMHLYNNVPGAVFRIRYDEGFTVVDANDGLYEFLGYTRDEFAALGNQISAVVYQEDMIVVREMLMEEGIQGNTIQAEQRLVCKDGQVKWVSMKAQLMPGDDGEAYFYGVFVDITDQKLAQNRVRELYERELAYFTQAALTEGSIQGRINVTRDRVENYVATDLAAIAQTGDSYEGAIGKLADSAFDTGYGGYLRNVMKRDRVLEGFAGGKTELQFEFLRKQKNGGAFWSRTNFKFYKNPESGDVIAFFYTLDVTEQKIQEQLLGKVTELDYEIISDVDICHDTYHVVSFHPDAVGMMPLKGRFRAESRVIAASFMKADARREYLAKLDAGYMQQMLKEHGSYNFMAEIHDEHGISHVKRFQVFYISRELGRVCIARTDVTDIIRQEQQQKEILSAALAAAEQANAAKTDFLSRMSHEIRTPMNAIIGMSAIAAQAVGNDEQVAECISKIGISSRFLLSLVNDILDMSRIESGKMLLKSENIPTEDFLNGLNAICYSQAASKGVDYECIADPTLDDCYIGDAMKLQQVLLNILSNAIKFTGEGGKVTFSAGVHRKVKTGTWLRFIVNDNGIGIHEDFLRHIFEPFAQESMGTTALYGGTGLGLPISKSIVDMMGGKISIRSIKGIGSEFTVDVQLGTADEELHRRSRKKVNPHFASLKTLVVDDDVTVCESAVFTLREMGITAEWVDSGPKAIRQVQALCGSGRHYDMILIDWKMPEMDGIETARRIRAMAGPEVTIIIMTAYDWVAIEHEAKSAGVDLLMSKPMFKSSLISAFSRALGEKEEAEARSAPVIFDFTGCRVLLVEDNAINTEVATMILESKGFAVDTAENGLRAIEMFSKSGPGSYDAILMDIRMPLMDGLMAANNIRHMTNADAGTIPIIAMTANAFEEDIEKSKAVGMNAHLAKPIEPERLFRVLYDLIML